MFSKLNIATYSDGVGNGIIKTVTFSLIAVAYKNSFDTMDIKLDAFFFGDVNKCHAIVDPKVMEIRRMAVKALE